MKRELRLYNVIFPIWLLFLFPVVLILVIPANLAVDSLVLLLTLLALKHDGKRAVLKQLWWKFWLLGFAADGVGVLWMLLGFLPCAISCTTHSAIRRRFSGRWWAWSSPVCVFTASICGL